MLPVHDGNLNACLAYAQLLSLPWQSLPILLPSHNQKAHAVDPRPPLGVHHSPLPYLQQNAYPARLSDVTGAWNR
jgi:hypothetical protein